jgi:hypothetical protein
MAELWSNRNEEPSPLPKVIHLTKNAYDALMGRLLASLTYGYDEMACGLHPDWTDRRINLQWIGEYGISMWKQGTLTVLPNCPSCSVAWDEAMEAYMARGST